GGRGMSVQPPANIVAAAQAAFRAYPDGAPVCVMLAQWALESGWGAHIPGGSNNPFGEKALPGDPSVAAPTTEIVDGHVVPTNAPFRAFPSVEAAFEFHAEHLATSRYYIAARACLPNVAAFCKALGGGTPSRPSYSTNPDYGKLLVSIIGGSNLRQYDAPKAANAPGPAAA
ncbi:MAG TPA: glucosaminidase domain-containing protein, partial [Caulobacteraceae bacterium]|nr:glucosaminidase domain-containing protein [Caulobacteraceae bacterium]